MCGTASVQGIVMWGSEIVLLVAVNFCRMDTEFLHGIARSESS